LKRARWVALVVLALLPTSHGAAKAAPAEVYQGTTVGVTADGHAFLGNPEAPLTLVEYTDYLCPFCGAHFRQTLPTLIEKYVRTGQVKYIVRDLPLASLHPTAARGATAALCAGEQGATRFWQMHDALFQAQQQWAALPDPTAFLAGAARKAGADMTAYEKCMSSGRGEGRVQQSSVSAQALGFTGTPTFQLMRRDGGKTNTLVGAQPVNVFTTWIDTVLAGKEPPQPKQPEKPELPFWAKPEGLAPDPKRPGFTVAGDPYKGKPEARLVVVEFADFQCPSCRRHALETQPALDRRFVETGEVMWVVKHFPLRAHPHAPVAAAAAVCAGEQGKFWEMHHMLFEQVDRWSSGLEADATLLRLAANIGMDQPRFAACLSSRQALEQVLRGLYDGQGMGVRNSPTFVLLQGGTGTSLVGARSAEQFESILTQQLDKARRAAKAAATGSGSPVIR
jgi:protein-disulfide isomerase